MFGVFVLSFHCENPAGGLIACLIRCYAPGSKPPNELTRGFSVPYPHYASSFALFFLQFFDMDSVTLGGKIGKKPTTIVGAGRGDRTPTELSPMRILSAMRVLVNYC